MMRPLLSLASVLAISSVLPAQNYRIVAPSGRVTATIEVDQGQLVVHEPSGPTIRFSREPRYDSPDGQFAGYISVARNRVLRFPFSGSGRFQSADLNAADPKFRFSDRTIRPAGDPAVNPPAGWTPPGSVANGWLPSQLPGGDGFPNNGNFTQYDMPGAGSYLSTYPYPSPQPQSVLIDSQTIALPPLSPALVRFRNSGRREIEVTVSDALSPQRDRSMRIKAGDWADMELQRDAGAKRVERYRVIRPDGSSITKQFVKQVPPVERYEVVVREWAMQSIAIDRTGKSPNVIEDINFQGKGLGRFTLPPGPQLQSGQIDAVVAARSQGNQGTIAPIVAQEDGEVDRASALERAMLEAQRNAQRGR